VLRARKEWRVLRRYLDVSGSAEDSRTDILVCQRAMPTLNFFQIDNQTYLDELGRGLGGRVLITGLTRCAPRPRDAYMQGAEMPTVALYNSGAVIDGVVGKRASRKSMTSIT
jgi:hypothetical protein